MPHLSLFFSVGSFYPEGARKSSSFSRIVSVQHHKRLHNLLVTTKGTTVLGGAEESDADDKYIAPTVVQDVKSDDPLMQDELFGPILPIVPVKDINEGIELINSRLVLLQRSEGQDLEL